LTKRLSVLIFSLLILFSLVGIWLYKTDGSEDGRYNIKEVSEEEYLNIVAVGKGISTEEATEYVNKIIKNYQVEQEEAFDFYYVVIYDKQELDKGVIVEIGVPGIMYANESTERFVNVESDLTYTKAISDIKGWDEFFATAYLRDSTTIVLQGRGRVALSESFALKNEVDVQSWTQEPNYQEYWQVVDLFYVLSLSE